MDNGKLKILAVKLGPVFNALFYCVLDNMGVCHIVYCVCVTGFC